MSDQFEHVITLYWHEVPVHVRRKLDEDYDKNHPEVPKEDRTLRVILSSGESDASKVKQMLIEQMGDELKQRFMIGQSVRTVHQLETHGFRHLHWPPQITIIEAGSTGVVTEASLKNGKIQYTVILDGSAKGYIMGSLDLEAIDEDERQSEVKRHTVNADQIQMDIDRGRKLIYSPTKYERYDELHTILMNLEGFTTVVHNENGEHELVWTVEVFW